MGHSWAMNVHDYGLANMFHGAAPGFRSTPSLAARLLVVTPYILTNVRYGPRIALTVALPGALGQVPYVTGSIFVPVGHDHFPYGYSVEADVHL